MAKLDLTTAAARDELGRPRFYPPGKHPALRQYVELLARLEEHLEECRRARVSTTECRKLIDWVGEKIAAFEEGEALAKRRLPERKPRVGLIQPERWRKIPPTR